MELVKYDGKRTYGSKSFIYIQRKWYDSETHKEWWEKVGEEMKLTDTNECYLMGEIARLKKESDELKENGSNPYVSQYVLTKKTITTEEFSTSEIW
jgi:hypothetical protein